jgi:lipoprotein-releasing system ATP-binding protein
MILKASKIKKSFGARHVLKDVSLEVERGQCIAICGKSGEGKSTLLHILGTLEKPDEGELFIDGQDASKIPLSQLRREKIGFIFQAFHLLEDYSVLENILMPAKISRREKEAVAKAKELLVSMGLQDLADSPVRVLSGGEKQRVAIARALINDPPILLADEPSGNLDAANKEMIHHLLLDVCRNKKKALIIVTHDKELSNLTDRVFTLKEGHFTT